MAALGGLACGAPSVDAALTRYAERIEAVLEQPSALSPPAEHDTAFPRRRRRRLATGEQRIGPFDFLDTVGCPLSERLAARNAALGRVLLPTRRLAHELAVLREGEACLPSLRADRAERLSKLLGEKRRDLPSHFWNAVWLDEDLERFLGAGPAVWVGRNDPADAPDRIRDAARVLEALRRDQSGTPETKPAKRAVRDTTTASVAPLETAFAALRDDPAIGPGLRQLAAATRALERVTRLIQDHPASACERQQVRLVHAFEESYLPLQPSMGALDRRLRSLLPELASLYAATGHAVEVPSAMAEFAREVLGAGAAPDAAERFRAQIVRHADAWNPILVRCGVIDAPTSSFPSARRTNPAEPFQD